MTHSTQWKRLSSGIAVLIMGGATVALAAETANVPPSTCVAASGTLTVRTDGQVENQGASSVTAICPADRKIVNGSFTTTFSARVWVVDQHSTQGVCCRAMSKNPSSGTVVTGTEICSSSESSRDQSLTTPSITDAYTYRHFYVQCTLPPLEGAASRLLTVRTTQQ
jgi:hypothetical protein